MAKDCWEKHPDKKPKPKPKSQSSNSKGKGGNDRKGQTGGRGRGKGGRKAKGRGRGNKFRTVDGEEEYEEGEDDYEDEDEASPVFQISCLLHRLCNMHRSKISLDPGSDVIILNPNLDLIHRSGILMQLEKFLNFARQISHVQQKLISFTDSDISKLPNND